MDGQGLKARKAVVIATGTTATVPPIDGLAEARPWTNREATTAAEIPGRLLVLGGGVVGVEMAQAFASLGASVTLIEAADRILFNEEPFVIGRGRRGLEGAGVDVRTGTKATAASRGDAGQVTLSLEGGEEVRGDELLVAVGRRPRTTELGLESVGVETGGYLEVDDQLRGQRLRVALRDRRRQRPCPAHPHGRVPGPDSRRPHPRRGRRGDVRQERLTARDLHRPRGRGRWAHPRQGRRGGHRCPGRGYPHERECRRELPRPERARDIPPRHR